MSWLIEQLVGEWSECVEARLLAKGSAGLLQRIEPLLDDLPPVRLWVRQPGKRDLGNAHKDGGSRADRGHLPGHLPQLMDETRGFINAPVFAAMKPDAVLINVARGEEVDEDALVEVVTAGRVRGAVLDVYAGELVGRPPRPERTTCDQGVTIRLGHPRTHSSSSPGYPHRSKAARLREYVVARGTDLGPVGADFGAICDQIDQADAMLAGLRERTRQGRSTPEAAHQDTGAQQPLVLARRDPDSRTVTLVLDAATANIAMFAIAAHADEREAHVREVERYGRSLPEYSYGRRNRQDIAAHETRVAARLRAVEQAYRTAIDHDTTYRPPDLTQTSHSPEHQPSRQSDPEAEP